MKRRLRHYIRRIRRLHIRKKYLLLAGSLLVLILLIVNINLIVEKYNMRNHEVGYIVSAANETPEPTPVITQPPQETEVPIDRNAWYMLLVNRWNPLPDNFQLTLHDLGNGESVDERIYPYLQQMFDAAKAEGFQPAVVSGYRTSEYQENLFNKELANFRSEGKSYDEAFELAQQWVALVGTSEHQAGLAVDINAAGGNGLVYSEKNQQIWAWLKAHCADYGFILRYPEGRTPITGIQYEPWHFRYVGTEAAAYIMAHDITFEEYLNQ